MKALHFGAGSIGRGFIGKLLYDNCLDVIFADVNQKLLHYINKYREYNIKIVGQQTNTETIRNISAVHSRGNQVLDFISNVSLITTSVGPQNLEQVAIVIAKGLIRRYKINNINPLNIIACENIVRGTSKLKQYVLQELKPSFYSWIEENVGFIDSSVDKIVFPTDFDKNNPLEVTVENFNEWIVDKTQFKGPIPVIIGMEPTDNLIAFIERKMFTLNTGHAITAYLGRLMGHEIIRTAILDPKVREVVKGGMEESGAVLINRYGFNFQNHTAYINKILQRFENIYLHDKIERVGRELIRKLSLKERLIAPLYSAINYGLQHTNLIKSVAAAMNYDSKQDPQTREWVTLLAKVGPRVALSQVSGLDEKSYIIAKSVESYKEIKKSITK